MSPSWASFTFLIFAQYLPSNQETQLAQKWKGRGLVKGAHMSKETTVLQLLQSQHASSKGTPYILTHADEQSGQDGIVISPQSYDQPKLLCKMIQQRKRILILSVKLLRMLISVWYRKKIILSHINTMKAVMPNQKKITFSPNYKRQKRQVLMWKGTVIQMFLNRRET